MRKLPEEQAYIDPRQMYPIGVASDLVCVDPKTLRSAAREGYIKYTTNLRNGRMRFLGKDLIYYRTYIR